MSCRILNHAAATCFTLKMGVPNKIQGPNDPNQNYMPWTETEKGGGFRGGPRRWTGKGYTRMPPDTFSLDHDTDRAPPTGLAPRATSPGPRCSSTTSACSRATGACST